MDAKSTPCRVLNVAKISSSMLYLVVNLAARFVEFVYTKSTPFGVPFLDDVSVFENVLHGGSQDRSPYSYTLNSGLHPR